MLSSQIKCDVCGATRRCPFVCCGKVWAWDDLVQASYSPSDECRREMGDSECYEGHCPHYRKLGVCCLCFADRRQKKKKPRQPRRVWTDANGVVHKEY